MKTKVIPFLLTHAALALAVSSSAPVVAQGTFGSGGETTSHDAATLRLFGTRYPDIPFDVEIRGEAGRTGVLLEAVNLSLTQGSATDIGARQELLTQLLRREGKGHPFQTDATGVARVRLRGWPAGAVGHLQAVFPGRRGLAPTVTARSLALQAAVQALPLVEPVITGFSQDSGGPGDTIVIDGFNFGTGSPDELAVVQEGVGFFDFVTLDRSDTQLTVQMLPFGGDPVAAGPLTVSKGIGGSTQIPDQGGFVFEEPVVGQCFDRADPDARSTSSIVFVPVPPVGPGVPCTTPPDYSSSYKRVSSWSITNGVASMTVPPEWCNADRMFLRLYFRRILPNGHEADRCIARDIVLPDLDPCNPFTANVVLSSIDLQLSSAFNAAGITCFTSVNGSTRTISVLCNDPISYVWPCSGLFVQYGPTSLAEVDAGIADDYVAPTESATPSAGLAAYIASIPAWGTTLDFDEVDADRAFGHTFSNLPARARDARLEIRMRPLNSLADNDGLSIGFNGSGANPLFKWGSAIRDLPEAGGAWTTNPSTIFCIDLTQVPTADGPRNLLRELCEGGGPWSLDVFLQDDTAVDSMSLKIRYCD